MKNLKKLPIVLALITTILAAACSEIDVTPRADDEVPKPAIIKPAPQNSAPADSVATLG